MTLLEPDAPEGLQGLSVPVLETERLILRAPRLGDAAAIAALVNDRRIAENTLRIPHPYALADAQAFLTTANASGGEIVFLITAWDGALLGCCGIGKLDGEHPEIGYWLGVPFWGKGYATEAAQPSTVPFQEVIRNTISPPPTLAAVRKACASASV